MKFTSLSLIFASFLITVQISSATETDQNTDTQQNQPKRHKGKDTLKGGVIGGLAGSAVGHPYAGGAIGAAAGHHHGKKEEKREQKENKENKQNTQNSQKNS